MDFASGEMCLLHARLEKKNDMVFKSAQLVWTTALCAFSELSLRCKIRGVTSVCAPCHVRLHGRSKLEGGEVDDRLVNVGRRVKESLGKCGRLRVP